eukprot:gene6090-4381_t
MAEKKFEFKKPDTTGWTLADFELKDTLGTGSFGRVRLAKRKGTEEFYAMKCLKKREIIRMKQVPHLHQEKSILLELSHPFIVNLFCSFQDDRKVYLLLEFILGGEMFTHLRAAGRFPNDVAKPHPGLLQTDHTKRLGTTRGGVAEIKSHSYFHGANWERLFARYYPAPINVRSRNAGDTSNFERYPDSPVDRSPGLTSAQQAEFKGF